MLALAGVAAVAALVDIAFPAAVNNAALGTDSVQTWTCQWAGAQGAPGDFSSLCHESVSPLSCPRRKKKGDTSLPVSCFLFLFRGRLLTMYCRSVATAFRIFCYDSGVCDTAACLGTCGAELFR